MRQNTITEGDMERNPGDNGKEKEGLDWRFSMKDFLCLAQFKTSKVPRHTELC